jgi:hypothetical protein
MATAVLLVAGGVALWTWGAQSAEPRLRRELEAWLSERLNSDVTLATLSVRLYPTLRIEGTGLLLRLKGRPDLPPFVTIRSWSGRGGFSGIRARRLDKLTLRGVEVIVPPGRSADLRSLKGDSAANAAGPRPVQPVGPPLTITRLVADAVRLTVMPRDPARATMVWDIRDLVMTPFSLDDAAPFSATVDTPLPADRARFSGRVGPWPRGAFDQLPLTGEYTFDGDLAAVPGLEGRLAASGSVLGTLERLATTGRASSPAFGLEARSRRRLPLNVAYEAVLDGTNSDVYLTRVTTVVAGSAFEASGRVTRARGVPGRHVVLAVKTPDRADVADVLRLLVDGARPPLSGRLGLDLAIDIPRGEGEVLDRLTAEGAFQLERGRFANESVKHKVDDLSRRGQGRPDDAAITGVASTMRGRLDLRRHQLTLRQVSFVVPGATIDASGEYGLRTERLAFRGTARLDATLSRTQAGARRWILRPLDPLLRKEGAGTRLVVDVQGTRAAPVVDLDVGASLRGRP